MGSPVVSIHLEFSIVPPYLVIEEPIIDPRDSPGIAALPKVPNPA